MSGAGVRTVLMKPDPVTGDVGNCLDGTRLENFAINEKMLFRFFQFGNIYTTKLKVGLKLGKYTNI